MTAPLLTLCAYLIGAFPTSYLVGRAYGYDLRREGSGNLGSTNAYRVLGFFPAVGVLIVDLLKGFVPVWLFPAWDGRTGAWALVYGLAAISGHVWPVYTKFRGGKGVATAAGTMAALVPVAVVVAFFVWVVTVILTRTASMASLLSAALVPIMARASAAPRSVIFYALLLAITVWWTHRSNLARIVRREEFQVDWRRGRLPRRERAARKAPEEEP